MRLQRIKNYEAKKEKKKWTLETLCDKVHTQLDAKWIKDEKDGNMKRKYRERAGFYTRKVHKDGLIPFVIDIQT